MLHRLRTHELLMITVLVGCHVTGRENVRTEVNAVRSVHRAETERSQFAADDTPHPSLDRWERMIHAPRKCLQRSVFDESQISDDTLALLSEYLDQQQLNDLRVTIREYAPGEWQERLRDRVGQHPPVTRYVTAPLAWTRSTLFPDRVFHRNRYDSSTDTLAINADRPFEILEQAAIAKRSRSARFPLLTQLPPMTLIHGIQADFEIIQWARDRSLPEIEQQGYRRLYPRLADTAGIVVMPLIPFAAAPVVGLGSHLAGAGAAEARIAYQRRFQLPQSDSSDFPGSPAQRSIDEQDE